MGETWAGIVRVSHVGARGGESFHADADQIADIERYAATRGARVVLMPPELSVSGGKAIEDRPSLQAAIEGVERGEFDGIVVAYLSRLTRSRSGVAIWDRVEAAGGHVHCASEQLDTSTPNGRFIRDIHLANAVREREEHADRHARRRAQTVAAGVWRQRQVPRGYRFAGPADEHGRFRGLARRLVAGDNAEQVRQAFRDRAAGVPVSRIADRLAMTTSGVRALLANRVYLGELRDGEENVNPAAHEPIVDPELFARVAGGFVSRPGRSRSTGPALLAGLARCAGCGHVMSRTRSGGTPVYACHRRHSGVRCPKPAAITLRLLDEHVERVARAELDRLAVAASISGGGVEDARDRVAVAERELTAFLAAVSAADVGVEAFAAAARERRDVLERAQAELRRRMALQPAIPELGRGVEVWEILDGHERNALLRALLEVVVVRRAGGRTVPVGERVQVLAHGAGVVPFGRSGGRPFGVVPLGFLDGDSEYVLGVPGAEDGF